MRDQEQSSDKIVHIWFTRREGRGGRDEEEEEERGVNEEIGQPLLVGVVVRDLVHRGDFLLATVLSEIGKALGASGCLIASATGSDLAALGGFSCWKGLGGTGNMPTSRGFEGGGDVAVT